MVLVGVEFLFTWACHVLFFTKFLDRPNLPVRRNAAIGDVALIGLLTILAVVALNRTGFDGGSLGWGSHAASG